MLLYWLHPSWQNVATVLALIALYLAVPRILALHFGRRRVFNWKRHVRLGSVALLLWILGIAMGVLMVRLRLGAFAMTGPHAWGGLALGMLALFGYATGKRLDTAKGQHAWLPAVHGLNNTALIVLAFWQIWTG